MSRSPGGHRRGYAPGLDRPRSRRSTRYRIGSAFHNCAVVAVVIQLCLLYVVAGLFKVRGMRWQEGTALYYVLRVAEYSIFPELARLLYEHALIVYAVTYLTVFLQAFFPLLLLRPSTRHLAFVLVTLMHLGIGVLMGIPFFSLFMISTDLILFTDREYTAIGAWLRRHGHPLISRTRPARTAPL
ncbi:HTTM domain-containing protein [Streptomyces jumonjinensis]|uniref:HTTM domain-containing protein n=1 Tax=Streptomyces jumonjinensis TaxID=1945 RepID=UPI0018868AA5|nr:HTTM domain-containing protein [Streptomyces jumonjinensis]